MELQNKTMQMMYETIYTALKEVGLENTYEPQDYLNFFCLGNREAIDLSNSNPKAEASPQVTSHILTILFSHIILLLKSC